eukprot:4629016-Pyramimonas_sp.AAC.1
MVEEGAHGIAHSLAQPLQHVLDSCADHLSGEERRPRPGIGRGGPWLRRRLADPRGVSSAARPRRGRGRALL